MHSIPLCEQILPWFIHLFFCSLDRFSLWLLWIMPWQTAICLFKHSILSSPDLESPPLLLTDQGSSPHQLLVGSSRSFLTNDLVLPPALPPVLCNLSPCLFDTFFYPELCCVADHMALRHFLSLLADPLSCVSSQVPSRVRSSIPHPCLWFASFSITSPLGDPAVLWGWLWCRLWGPLPPSCARLFPSLFSLLFLCHFFSLFWLLS